MAHCGINLPRRGSLAWGLNFQLFLSDTHDFGGTLENPISCHVNEQKERFKPTYTLAQ